MPRQVLAHALGAGITLSPCLFQLFTLLGAHVCGQRGHMGVYGG